MNIYVKVNNAREKAAAAYYLLSYFDCRLGITNHLKNQISVKDNSSGYIGPYSNNDSIGYFANSIPITQNDLIIEFKDLYLLDTLIKNKKKEELLTLNLPEGVTVEFDEEPDGIVVFSLFNLPKETKIAIGPISFKKVIEKYNKIQSRN